MIKYVNNNKLKLIISNLQFIYKQIKSYKPLHSPEISIKMSDPFSDATFTTATQSNASNKSQLNLQSNENRKLPKIDKQKESTKIAPNMDKIFAKSLMKSNTKLPHLKIDSTGLGLDKEKDQNAQGKTKQNLKFTQLRSEKLKIRQKSQGDDFMSEIEKKLRTVLENQNSNDNLEEASDSDQDFEKKIEKNRQKIKKEKIKRELGINVGQDCIPPTFQKSLNNNILGGIFNSNKKIVSNAANKHESQQKIEAFNPNPNNSNFSRPRNKVDSMYEKRIKDYRDQSFGNKFLVKKKESISHQQQITIKKQSPQEAEPLSEANGENYLAKKPKVSKRKNIHKTINNLRKEEAKDKNKDRQQGKDQDLFENLHNILLNPRRSDHDIVKQRAKKTREELQQQMKQIQEKLKEQRKQDLQLLDQLGSRTKKQCRKERNSIQETVAGLGKEEHTLSWRKIQVLNCYLEAKRTNFDEEIERVNKYLERNEKSIQKYIENQRRLLVNTSVLRKLKSQKQSQL